VKLVLVLVALCCCVQPRSERCKVACAREYECTKEMGSSLFDEKQCIAVCSELVSQQAARVEAHAQCVAAHPVCSEALECRW
jgi:hypothetical protein